MTPPGTTSPRRVHVAIGCRGVRVSRSELTAPRSASAEKKRGTVKKTAPKAEVLPVFTVLRVVPRRRHVQLGQAGARWTQ